MAREPDHVWFTAAVSPHLDAVYRYFLRRAPRQDADDLTAEVFAVAWRRRVDIPREAILPWLYRTAGFILANHRRRVVPLPLAELPERPAPDLADAAADRDALGRALARLGERERDVILLHAWEGLDGAALADALGVSRSGAQSALSRARAKFRAVWEIENAAADEDAAQEATPA